MEAPSELRLSSACASPDTHPPLPTCILPHASPHTHPPTRTCAPQDASRRCAAALRAGRPYQACVDITSTLLTRWLGPPGAAAEAAAAAQAGPRPRLAGAPGWSSRAGVAAGVGSSGGSGGGSGSHVRPAPTHHVHVARSPGGMVTVTQVDVTESLQRERQLMREILPEHAVSKLLSAYRSSAGSAGSGGAAAAAATPTSAGAVVAPEQAAATAACAAGGSDRDSIGLLVDPLPPLPSARDACTGLDGTAAPAPAARGPVHSAQPLACLGAGARVAAEAKSLAALSLLLPPPLALSAGSADGAVGRADRGAGDRDNSAGGAAACGLPAFSRGAESAPTKPPQLPPPWLLQPLPLPPLLPPSGSEARRRTVSMPGDKGCGGSSGGDGGSVATTRREGAEGVDPCGVGIGGGGRRARLTHQDVTQIAREHASVTVLFADIVGFTQRCATLEPRQVSLPLPPPPHTHTAPAF
eukprot:364955-Chlamydomonas_euryale.AAC.13